MDDAARRRMGQARGDLQHVVDRFLHRDAAANLQDGPQVFALDKLEGDEVQPLIFAAKEHAGDVLVVQAGGTARFLVEAADAFRIGRHLGRQDFQSNTAIELLVLGANDGRHAADADLLHQFKMGQAFAAEVGGNGLVGPAAARRAR